MAYVENDILESFIAEALELLESIKKNVILLKGHSEDKELLASTLRDIHTLKGNSRMLGFNNIEKLAHAIEDVYKSVKDEKISNSDRLIVLVTYVADKIGECCDTIKKKNSDSSVEGIEVYLSYCDKIAAGEIIDMDTMTLDIQRLKQNKLLLENEEEDDDDNIAEIKSIRIKLSRINEIIRLFDNMITREFRLKHQIDALRAIEEETGNTDISKIRKQFESDLTTLETCIFDTQQQVFDLRMLPISMVLKPFENTIVVEAMQLGKKVNCDIPETDIALDKVILEQLSDVLLHLVRNSLDHGIESAEERKKAGKNEIGNISIKCIQKTKHIELTVTDDGAGVDFEKVREKAIKNFPENADEIKNMNNRELSQYLFKSGFSTKENITEMSGRGVGLDVVWTNMEKVKGKVRVESEKGKGTSFILTFPVSLATLQGLFIFSNKEKFFIPSQHIADILYRKKSEYIKLQSQLYMRLGEQLIPIYSLSSLFKDQKEIRTGDSDTILIADYMEQRIGIIVSSVQSYVSLVVKPLPNAFRNFSILQGIVFDEHYDIVPILYVPDIITKFKSLRGYDIKKYEANTKKRVYKILLVDDSETTRQIEHSILKSEEYAIDEAVDGIEGLEKIKKKQYDLIISDKDMPRMNGITMIDNVRRMENYQNIPIIIISADQNPEVLSKFEKSGINAFIAKSDFKRGNLINAVKELLHE